MIVRRYALTNHKGINKSFAVIADTHGTYPRLAIDVLKKSKPPDYIAIVGDVVDRKRQYNSAVKQLFQDCNSIAPTFFSYGNNDRNLTDGQVSEISSYGTIILDNTWVEIVPGFFIAGLTSANVIRARRFGIESHELVASETEWLKDFEKLNGYKVLLDHHPENYEIYTKNMDVDLILSGHTHGGQISVLGYGLFVPGQKLWPRYSGGIYDNKLVISRGLSNTLLIPRLGNPTELVYVEIKSDK